ncbi:hypothetical protein F2P56_003996 [Juglans regia]|uniref:Reverse transcriptase domain-containing protein n=2 Tax=Juglans regia TaxID=51240 RepID=A0A833XTH1_JUGRE|nr:uncharacterized protein LOC109001745 [Juglans regia]KAF5477347.1 hypothetical protein F2P56_003996 [Juglans regia]
MDPKTRQALNELLVMHKDAFSWRHEDVLGIENVVVEHRLCVDLGHALGLKNAGATNQRFRNYMSKKQIGHNMEVYVDNLLVKSKELKHHLADLREAFVVLRQYGMNLNLMNCAFGVNLSKFFELKGVEEFIRKFEKCQLFEPVPHCLPEELTSIMSP